jgi:ketosteroid isomerase-like protein
MYTIQKSVRTGLLITLLAAVAVASPTLAGDKSDMAGRAQVWQDAFNSGAGTTIAGLYTEDAMRLPYQAPTIEGRDAIAANIAGTREAGITSIKLEVTGAESQGNMGWGHGTYVLMDGEGNTVQSGKWMNVSKKVEGKWLIHCDIWNTNAPEE